MRNIKHSALKGLQHARHIVRPTQIPRSVIYNDIPYFAQWESPELVGQIVAGTLTADKDPKWRTSGAKTKEEYLEWSWNMCGMACFRMILAHRNKQVVPIVKLGKLCLKHGGYSQPFAESNGMNYTAFKLFAKSEFGLAARIVSPMVLRDIHIALARGDYVIVSVNPAIRNPSSRPKSKGGHLVLVTGYDLDKKILYIHNPSGASTESQRHAIVRFSDFKRFFANRGIVVGGS